MKPGIKQLYYLMLSNAVTKTVEQEDNAITIHTKYRESRFVINSTGLCTFVSSGKNYTYTFKIKDNMVYTIKPDPWQIV